MLACRPATSMSSWVEWWREGRLLAGFLQKTQAVLKDLGEI